MRNLNTVLSKLNDRLLRLEGELFVLAGRSLAPRSPQATSPQSVPCKLLEGAKLALSDEAEPTRWTPRPGSTLRPPSPWSMNCSSNPREAAPLFRRDRRRQARTISDRVADQPSPRPVPPGHRASIVTPALTTTSAGRHARLVEAAAEAERADARSHILREILVGDAADRAIITSGGSTVRIAVPDAPSTLAGKNFRLEAPTRAASNASVGENTPGMVTMPWWRARASTSTSTLGDTMRRPPVSWRRSTSRGRQHRAGADQDVGRRALRRDLDRAERLR